MSAILFIGALLLADVGDVFTSMASALSEGNAAAFLKAFDPKMPGYAKLREQVEALLAQAAIGTSIEILRNEGDEKRREVELDWYLDIRTREQRREVVKCRLERRGKVWKIVALEPLEFFSVQGRDDAMSCCESKATYRARWLSCFRLAPRR